MKYYYEGQIIWSQIDANWHLRHSAYADIATQARTNMLMDAGITLAELNSKQIGPILFHEELFYKKEILLNEYIKVAVEITKMDLTKGRFSVKHIIYNAAEQPCAEVYIDGALISSTKRKIVPFPEDWKAFVQNLPQAEGCEIIG